MPDTLHPPYNISQPRVLNRWLDVNSQNGPLKRAQTFIIIPAFNIPYAWNGYSDVIAIFSYSTPNRFSFIDVEIPPVDSNEFLLCVSYITNDGTTRIRYALNYSPYANIFFNLPIYTGQVIDRNFQIEVWGVDFPGLDAILESPLVFLTSVKQNVDYRFGNDVPLANPSAIEFPQFSITFLPPAPIEGLTDLQGTPIFDLQGDPIIPLS